MPSIHIVTLLLLLLLSFIDHALWVLGVAGAGYLLLSHPEQPLPLCSTLLCCCCCCC
jgi:hypothetical protein